MNDQESRRRLREATDIAIRIGALGLLAVWCFIVISPFLLPIAWGVIIAIALQGPHAVLSRWLGGRGGLAATLMVLAILAVAIAPGLMIADSLADDVEALARSVNAGTLRIPPPAPEVQHWPLVGPRAYLLWSSASQDLSAVLAEFAPRARGAASWLLGSLAQFGIALLQFIFSGIISGFVLANWNAFIGGLRALATRLMRDRGPELLQLAAATVRGVTRGILGVALIQTLLAGAALFLAGVPGAALWSIVALILAVVQVGVGLVMFPAALWLFTQDSTTTAIAFLIWSIVLAPLDNILKPILMGRGLNAPVLVVFMGAIGGFVTQGIIGLFVGAVILVMGYELCRAWLDESDDYDQPATGSEPPS